MSRIRNQAFQRLVKIAYDHISCRRRYPSKLADVARRMDMNEDAALAAVIADQIIEEFDLSPNRGFQPCLLK